MHASPLTAYVRVPLGWYRSTTHARYPDETHSSIRRVYHAQLASEDRRQFCGYCGTQLSSWSERNSQDAELIFLTLESLLEEDVEMLETMGLFSGKLERQEAEAVETTAQLPQTQTTSAGATETLSRATFWTRGASWFEDIIESGNLGRHIRRQRGGRRRSNGEMHVDYDFVEIAGDEASAYGGELSSGKRKYEGSHGEAGGGL